VDLAFLKCNGWLGGRLRLLIFSTLCRLSRGRVVVVRALKGDAVGHRPAMIMRTSTNVPFCTPQAKTCQLAGSGETGSTDRRQVKRLYAF